MFEINNDFFSSVLDEIQPSATAATNARATALKEQGREVLDLSFGEPDFMSPPHVRKAAAKAIMRGEADKYPPQPGLKPFREFIVRKFKRENNLDYRVAQIMVCAGGKHAIEQTLRATLNPGDEVLIVAPFWVSYPDITILNRGKPVIIQTQVENNWKLTPEALEAAITAKTKWLIFNQPSNPSTVVYSKEEIRALGEVLQRHPRVWILSDEIYEHMTYGENRFHSFAAVNPELYDRTVTMNGLAKAYSMTGWRVGYVGAHEKLITAMSKISSQSNSGVCRAAQIAGIAALDGPTDYMVGQNAEFGKRLTTTAAELRKIPGIECPDAMGAFYLFMRVANYIGRRAPSGKVIADDIVFADELLETTGLATVAGSPFGAPGYNRWSAATDMRTLMKATQRMAEFCGATIGPGG